MHSVIYVYRILIERKSISELKCLQNRRNGVKKGEHAPALAFSGVKLKLLR